MPRREYLLRAAAAETAVGGEVCNPRLEALMQVGRLEEAPLQLHVRFRNFRRHRPPRALALLLPWRGGGGRSISQPAANGGNAADVLAGDAFGDGFSNGRILSRLAGEKSKLDWRLMAPRHFTSAPSAPWALGSDTRSSLETRRHRPQHTNARSSSPPHRAPSHSPLPKRPVVAST